MTADKPNKTVKDKEREYDTNLIEEGGESEAEDADLSKEIAKIEESLNKKN
ncbi:MAG: hypothetical protein ACK5YA_00805 [bacterium]|jgi:hypothetical protein